MLVVSRFWVFGNQEANRTGWILKKKNSGYRISDEKDFKKTRTVEVNPLKIVITLLLKKVKVLGKMWNWDWVNPIKVSYFKKVKVSGRKGWHPAKAQKIEARSWDELICRLYLELSVDLWSVLLCPEKQKKYPRTCSKWRLLTAGGDPSVTDPTSGVTSVDIKTQRTFHLQKNNTWN